MDLVSLYYDFHAFGFLFIHTHTHHHVYMIRNTDIYTCVCENEARVFQGTFFHANVNHLHLISCTLDSFCSLITQL